MKTTNLKHYPKMPGGLVLCGSSRFYEEMQEYGRWAAKIMGMVITDVTLPEGKTEDIETKSELMKRHRNAINAWCPMLIVYNGKEDYIGLSTAMEIGQAYATGKANVIFLSHPTKIPELLALGLRVIERDNAICDIVPCGKPIYKLDLCKEHYIELKETDIDTVKPQNKPDCPNCNKPMFAAGMRSRYDDKGNYLGIKLDEPIYLCMECDL